MSEPLSVGSLFAGIGGFDLGLERAGMVVKWQVEIDPFCRAVLAKHWPAVRRYEDVREVHARGLCGSGGVCDGCLESVDLVCGGFPCQPFSSASRGRKRGTEDARHLWPQMRRVVSQLQPAWVLLENVTHLDGPGLAEVVSNLETLDYEVGPTLEVPACAVGLDHWRPRLWLLGYTDRNGQSGLPVDAEVARLSESRDDAERMGATHGLSGGMDRRRMSALGNAIVPDIAEWIARAILDAAGAPGGPRDRSVSGEPAK